MKKKNILLYIIGLLAIYGCQQEYFDELITKPIEVREGDRVQLGFSLITSDFGSVSTRMSEDEENQWDIVWVAQFDKDGNIVGSPKQYDNEKEMLEISALEGDNTLYFVTNVVGNPFVDAENNDVSNLTDLNKCKFKIEELSDIENAKKIVMVGVWTGKLVEDVLAPGDNTQLVLNEIVVYARRITSKINIVIEATLPNVTFQEKKIYVEKMQLCAVPLQASFVPGSVVTSGDQLKDFEEEVFSLPEDGGYTYNSQSYYVLENMHGDKPNEEGAPKKGNFAPKDNEGRVLATYVKIRAYIDDGANTGYVDYRVYLGKNADKNFDIERNFHYTITIKIQGRGPEDIETDVRIESIADLHQLQLQTPGGDKATNRGAETRYITSDKEVWGWVGTAANTSLDHLKVFTNGADWTLESLTYSTMPTNANYVWDGLSLEYNTVALGNTWRTVVKDQPIPGDAKIRLRTGINKTSYNRTATIAIKLYNAPGSAKREWRVSQYRAPGLSMPAYSFFPGEAGVYSIAVRATGTTSWKFESQSAVSSTLRFVGTVSAEGFSNDISTWQKGHGSLLFEVGGRGGLTGVSVHRDLGTVKITYKNAEQPDEISTAETKLSQLATAQQLLDTKKPTTGRRFAYDYTSNPLFNTVVGFYVSGGIPWSMNMLDGATTMYDDNKGLVGTTSPVTGKENTLEIFKKMDKEAENVLSYLPGNITVKGTPIFTPAGICMSLNKEYWEIENANDPRFEWYLPSRNEALMDVFISMLGLDNAGNGINKINIWTSTVNASTTKENSAYFAGSNVDVSAVYSVLANVRCIRRKKDSEITDQTYPYLKNVANTPVVVVREDGKGFVDKYRPKPNIVDGERYYRIDYPLRYSTAGNDPTIDGKGPIETKELTMSPKFQVAKKNATTASVIWYIGAGWKGNLDFKNLATDPETGCQAYVEDGENGVRYNDWRLPTEMELRLIGLLGAGMTKSDNQKYILQKDGVNFTDIPGFVRMDGNYWTGTEYRSAKEKDIRANYVTIRNFGHTDFPLRGTAINRTSTSMNVRCVRDVH